MHKYLTKEDLVLIHAEVVEATGGSHGVRDPHLLMSLEGQPSQSVFGKELYPGIFLKAAIYTYSILTAHPFVDGNKRTGMVAALSFLEMNGYRTNIPEGALFDFARSVVTDSLTREEIAEWLEKHTEPV